MTAGLDDDGNEFYALCARQHRGLDIFRRDYPDLEVVFGGAFVGASLLIGSVSTCADLSEVEIHRSVMWQTMFDYQAQSSLLLATRKLDAGLALIRLAAELARDVAVIRDDEERLDIWLHRRDPIRQIQDLVAEEVPYMVLTVGIAGPFARKGVTAFRDDFAGGADAGRIHGTFSRNPMNGTASGRSPATATRGNRESGVGWFLSASEGHPLYELDVGRIKPRQAGDNLLKAPRRVDAGDGRIAVILSEGAPKLLDLGLRAQDNKATRQREVTAVAPFPFPPEFLSAPTLRVTHLLDEGRDTCDVRDRKPSRL